MFKNILIHLSCLFAAVELNAQDKWDVNISANLGPSDGFCGGLGVEAPIGNNANVSLGFRYNHGQGNMQADTRSIPLYNRSLNFNIGISQGF